MNINTHNWLMPRRTFLRGLGVAVALPWLEVMSVNAKNIQPIIEGAASRGVTVRVGGELFSDAMGNAGTYEGTYIGMIDHNATLIARALGGDVPAKGMNGKLSGVAK